MGAAHPEVAQLFCTVQFSFKHGPHDDHGGVQAAFPNMVWRFCTVHFAQCRKREGGAACYS